MLYHPTADGRPPAAVEPHDVVWWCGMVRHGMARYGMVVSYSVLRYGTVCYGMVRCSVVLQYAMVCYDAVWYSMLWAGLGWNIGIMQYVLRYHLQQFQSLALHSQIG